MEITSTYILQFLSTLFQRIRYLFLDETFFYCESFLNTLKIKINIAMHLEREFKIEKTKPNIKSVCNHNLKLENQNQT